MATYFYDLECYHTLFMGIFIPFNAPQALIDEYIHTDVYVPEPARSVHKALLLKKMNALQFAIHYDVNDLNELFAFLNSQDLTLFGFNNNKYDDIMLAYLLANINKLRGKTTLEICEIMKAHNDNVIEMGYSVYHVEKSLKGFKKPFTSYDILNGLFETGERKPLKQFAISLKWYRIQDLPHTPDTYLPKGSLPEVADYCVNDVLITRAIFNLRKKDFADKIEYSKLYGLDLTNKNKSSIASALLAKFYMDRTGYKFYEFKDKRTYRTMIPFKDIVDPTISFVSPELIKFHNKILSTRFIPGADTFSETVIFNNIEYSLGVGGIHSADLPARFVSDDEWFIIDVDGDSYYPITGITMKIAPAHLDQEAFLGMAAQVVNDRITAKKAKITSVANSLKIVVNSGLFGKYGSELEWFYDLVCLYGITINCQLRLLKLIELFTLRNIQAISANTDGVTCRIHKSQLDSYYEAVEEWKKLFTYTVEYSHYNLYVRTSVNDYLAKFDNGEIKRKGDFVVDLAIEKGYGIPIVAKALNEYYLNNVPLEDTIYNKDRKYDIYDYCLTQNVSREYATELHSLGKDAKGNAIKQIDPIQHTVRYIVTKTGSVFMKRQLVASIDKKTGKKKPIKQISVLAKQYITPFNRYFPVKNFSDYNLEYSWYMIKAREIVNNIAGTSTKMMKKTSGSLFDNL